MKRRTFFKQTATACAVAVLPFSIFFAKQTAIAKSAIMHEVTIVDFEFSIDALSVKVGDTIKWVNSDIVPHTATAKDASWDTGLIEAGGQATIIVTEKFSSKYYCEYHPMMTASILVKNE